MRIRVRVRFSFLFLNAMLFLLRSSRTAAAFYLACGLHELGHIAAIYLTGGCVRSLDLSAFGVIMTARYTSSAAVLLSGPLVNLVLAAAMYCFGASDTFTWMQLAAGVFNLLPFSGLDGGSLAELFVTGAPHERELRYVLTALKILTAGAMCFFAGAIAFWQEI